MVGEQSLQDILNVVAKGAAIGPVSQNSSKRTIEGGPTLTEFDAFSVLDPLLADLQKRYLDAKAQRLQAVQEFGPGDAMADMAMLMEDSAWCAVQTRYMELRSDRAMMRQAQTMMFESIDEERAVAQAMKEKEALKTMQQMQMFARMHEAPKKDSDIGWWAILYMFAQQPQEHFRSFYPAHQFNRMAA